MNLLFIFGTRPEAIKLAPLIKICSLHFNVKSCLTGQHREMVRHVLDVFEIEVDYNLDIMTHGQTLSSLSSKLMSNLDLILESDCFDYIIIQGDTTSAFIGALSAFYHKVKVLHVEAGLRTNDIYSPYPEELNRLLISKIAHFHFAPLEINRLNLVSEKIDVNRIVVTGNTGIDALLWVLRNKVPDYEFPFDIIKENYVLITGHRRENFGQGFNNICTALRTLALNNLDLKFVYPVHLNPNVQAPVQSILSDVSNIFLIDPLDYVSFCHLMNNSMFIITDSGGVQEEAPCLGKPLLVMRETTERLSSSDLKSTFLVGTDVERIVSSAQQLIDDATQYKKLAIPSFPYGDGRASERITDFLLQI